MKHIRGDRGERPNRTETPGGVWVVRLAVVAVAINVGYWVWHFGSPSRAGGTPAYGEVLPQWSAQAGSAPNTADHELFTGHFGLLLYADRVPSTPLIRYLQVLLDRYGDHGPGLRVALALAPEHVKREAVGETVRDVAYAVIHDSGGELRRALRLRPHDEHTFLVEPDGRLVLSAAGLADRDELRQHVEKNLLGEIQYRASPVSLLGPEARLPAYDVLEATGSGKAVVQSYSPPSGTTVVVLPAELCASCGTGDLDDRIDALYRRRCESASADDCRFELLVTAGYPIDDLLSSPQFEALEGLRAFQATGSLAGLEDDYFTKRRRGRADALVLYMGPHRRVAAVSTLAEETEEVHAQ